MLLVKTGYEVIQSNIIKIEYPTPYEKSNPLTYAPLTYEQ